MKKVAGGLLAAIAILANEMHAGEELPEDRAATSNAQQLPASDSRQRFAKRSPPDLVSQPISECDETISAEVYVDQGHPWAPPFGIDRVGAPVVVQVSLTSDQAPRREYYIVARRSERESEPQALRLRQNPSFRLSKEATKDPSPYFGRVPVTSIPEEVVLYARCPLSGAVEELTRQRVIWPSIEADAVTRSNRQINPVDLGAILVPHDWLMLAGGQTALLSAAALSHDRNIPGARLRAWFKGGKVVEVSMPLAMGKRVVQEIDLPSPSSGDRAVLHVSLTDGDQELWSKEIHTMLVARPPRWPAFGAVETKLRYDAPIAVHDPNTGAQLPSIDYERAWDPKFNDVVIFLPNGSRFVFWRGSSYVPFWASPDNTGLCYQWAENLSIPVRHPDGSADLPEPLFDRQLRYGRVNIVESTSSRVHVRWTYQPTDSHYNVWGDQATEDYYFYPDGFGTRVLTVISEPDVPYQLTEIIVLTPQRAFPLDVLPSHMADVLFLDGEKKSITFPLQDEQGVLARQPVELVSNPRQVPIVYRFFAHRNDLATAIYFSPRESATPGAYWPFYDRAQMVTSIYWGSHWPLGRGKWTHWTIDDGIHSGPAHSSVAAWVSTPEPLSTETYRMPDMLGRSKNMTIKRWVALIAKTNSTDEVLLDWAQSFSDAPSLDVTGARIDFPSYSPERRAMRVIAESSLIQIKLKPVVRTVNPVFELGRAHGELTSVSIDGRILPSNAYAWDGATLWMKATIDSSGAKIAVSFR